MTVNLTSEPLEILNPDKIDFSSYDYAVMPTGSIANDSLFVEHGLKILNSTRLKHLFIWGGFHDIIDSQNIFQPTDHLKNIFNDTRTYFYARGWIELSIYHMLVGGGRGTCGGDPVLLNKFLPHRKFSPTMDSHATLILSGHACSNMSEIEIDRISNLVSVFPRICIIEGAEDNVLLQKLNINKVCNANTLSKYAAVAHSSSIIVTQRLHGLAFAKAVSACLPVIIIPPKNDRCNFKYHSVADSAIGFRLGVSHIRYNFTADDALKVIKKPNSYLRREHEVNFVHYINLTEDTFQKILVQIKS
jgi:hypothetical protein